MRRNEARRQYEENGRLAGVFQRLPGPERRAIVEEALAAMPEKARRTADADRPLAGSLGMRILDHMRRKVRANRAPAQTNLGQDEPEDHVPF